MKVEINPSYLHLSSFIHALPHDFEKDGEVIYKGRNELRLFIVDGLRLVVKRFRRPHLINRFVYGTLRKSKAYRSYHYAFGLLDKGVNTPVPVAYIEEYSCGLRYSYYVTLESPSRHEIREFCFVEDVGDNRYILEAFGAFTADLHNKGVLHQDYSPGNILFEEADGLVRFALVDINRMQFKEVDEKEGYYNLRRLWLTDEVYRVIARAYAEGRGFNPDKAEQRILALKNHFMENRYK